MLKSLSTLISQMPLSIVLQRGDQMLLKRITLELSLYASYAGLFFDVNG